MIERISIRDTTGVVALVSRLAPFLAMVAAVLVLYGGLLTDVGFESHEQFNTYARTDQYLREFSHGNWLPQVFPDAVRGAGSAFPQFYPPLSYLITAALAWMTGDVILGVNLSFFLTTLLSAAAMYYLVIKLSGDRLASLAAALLYVTVPYRFMNIFVRGALAEAWSFTWYPLILAGTWSALTRRRFPWYLPVVWAALLLTHTITGVYFVLFYIVLVAAILIRERNWRPPTALVCAAAIGVGLSLWFLLPQQRSMHSALVGDARLMDTNVEAVARNDVSVTQLIGDYHSGWRGRSDATTIYRVCAERDPRLVPARGDLKDDLPLLPYFCPVDYGLGTGQLLAIGVGTTVLAASLGRTIIRKRRRARAGSQNTATKIDAAKHGGRTWLLSLFVLAWFGCVAFMIRPRPFLSLLPSPFSYIQFSWRLLGLSAFLSAGLLGMVAAKAHSYRWAKAITIAASILLVFATPAYLRSFHGTTVQTVDAAFDYNTEADRGFTFLGEYAPKTFVLQHLGPNLSKLPEIRDNGAVMSWHRQDGELTADVDVTGESVIVFPVLYYDFYRVTANGSNDVPTFESEGFLAARLPAHTTTVRVSRRLTRTNYAGLASSGLAAIVLVGILLRRRGRVDAGRAWPWKSLPTTTDSPRDHGPRNRRG